MTVVPMNLVPGARVLVVGAGGGFDFMCGLPIAIELEERGHPTFIASYSFTHLHAVRGGIWRTPGLLEVTPAAECDDDYFPERHLSAWFADVVGLERPIWCLGKGAVADTRESLDYLVGQHGIDAVICVDGGVDGIFRGDEADLGTPSMDSVTVLATHTCAAAQRLYACTAFGVEGAEGTVSHAQALERMAELTAQGAFRGVGAIVPTDPVGQRFVDAARYVFSRTPPLRRSIIVSSMLAALGGAHGRTAVHEKTRDRPPWISLLTLLFWYFEADAVAKLKLFYEDALEARTLGEVAEAIERARTLAGVKPFVSIPI
ncbi:MAG: DUF1152 domain-containing protein [Polyangiaceae bacterium]|nr:DUF1152 domain-containing protein [Polyangiaceae bacterium]